jgi:hypothetical protein
MRIGIELAFDEWGALRLLNWLANENAILLRSMPELPLLYDSGVVYRREKDETWCDFLNLIWQGHEDCDGLAAARAGELKAKGWKALRPGELGYREAQRLRPESIDAEVFLRTRAPQGRTGLYHCLVHYSIGGAWFQDDPSARLGMYGSIPTATRQRWQLAGVRPRKVWRTA